jgi:agmatine/peptidylarginine deiminase/PKD repeat protein
LEILQPNASPISKGCVTLIFNFWFKITFMKSFCILFLTLLVIIPSAKSQMEDLPKYMTPYEETIWEDYLESLRASRQSGELPEVPVRVMGEWEEIQALFVTWRSFPAILTEIVRHAVEEVTVYIITENESSVSATLINAGISLDNVKFMNWPSNTVWIRDYGPWAVYENDVEQLAISDYIYNRPRPLDDAVPERVAEEFDLPFYAARQAPFDWVHTGGNNLVDGYKAGYSSKITLVENPDKSEAEIDYMANRLFGYEQYVKFEELPYDAISHLDMHMRFIDEETVIIGEYPEGVADGPQINENIEFFLHNHTTSFGNPYEIVRIPMPPAANGNYPDEGGHYRTFTNSIFLNGTILVPIYEEQYDTVGLRIYRENLPGYNVVGIDCNAMIGSFGALHCITKTVGVDDPLWIAHARQRNLFSDYTSPEINAIIKHRTGIEKVDLFYKTSEEDEYSTITMKKNTDTPEEYTATLPAFSYGTEIRYYIEAQAVSGKTQQRPIVAPEGYYSYEVVMPPASPSAAFSVNNREICPGGTVRFLDRSENGVVERQWVFPGGEPGSSQEVNPVVAYLTDGNYDVILIASNELGSDTLVLENYIQVEGGISPFVENFEWGVNAEVWDNYSIPSIGFEWEEFEGSNCYDNRAIRVDNFREDNRGQTSVLTSVFNLGDMEEPHLYFSLAYAPYSAEFADRLQVEVTNCQGESRVVYDQSALDLATAPPTGDIEFVPADCAEWRDVVVDISDFNGDDLTVTFGNIGGWGNVLYLDNIFIKDARVENLEPVVAFLHPGSDTSFQSDYPMELTWMLYAEDYDGFVSDLELRLDGEVLVNLDTEPFTYILSLEEPGVYELMAVATDNEGLKSEPSRLIVDAQDIGSYIEGESSDLNWEVFPNPSNGFLQLKHSGVDLCSGGQWWIADRLGKKVFGPAPTEVAEQGVLLRELTAGSYYFVWEFCDQKLTKAFILGN